MTTYYDVLRRPLITEKSNYLNGQLHQYVFEVAPYANKGLVKAAVESIFDVKVLQVNVINMPLKRKRNLRNRRITNRRAAFKKAIVTLASGDTIAMFEGVK